MDIRSNNFEEELFLEVDKQYLGSDVYTNEDSLLVYGVLRSVVEGNLEKLKYFVKIGKSLNVNDNSGNTALHVAVLKNNTEILDYLLFQTNIDINTQNFLGETALFKAIKNGRIDTAKKLIEAGANVNIQNYEEVTPLHLSVTHPDLAHILILHGAYLDATDYSGDTPLHDATAEECLETVCMLLYYNADANVKGVNDLTPFMKALITQNYEIQAALIEYVSDFNSDTLDHITTLALALSNESPFIEEIINGGADVNYAYEYDLVDPFSICLQVPNQQNFRLIWEKLKYNGDDMALGSVLWRISGNLRKDYFKQYIDVIIESDNMYQVVDSVSRAEDFYMVIVRFCDFFHQLSIEQLTKLMCRLLTYGYVATSFDMSKVFLHYGYCELFKILLHMDIKLIDSRPPDTSRIIYDVKTKVHVLLDQLVAFINTEYLHNTIYQLLDYCIYPKLINAYLNLNKNDYVTFKILHLPRVPSLVELSRNRAREFIIDQFRSSNGCQFYTLINYLDISSVYKKILSFEKVIYRPNTDEIYKNRNGTNRTLLN